MGLIGLIKTKLISEDYSYLVWDVFSFFSFSLPFYLWNIAVFDGKRSKFWKRIYGWDINCVFFAHTLIWLLDWLIHWRLGTFCSQFLIFKLFQHSLEQFLTFHQRVSYRFLSSKLERGMQRVLRFKIQNFMLTNRSSKFRIKHATTIFIEVFTTSIFTQKFNSDLKKTTQISAINFHSTSD